MADSDPSLTSSQDPENIIDNLGLLHREFLGGNHPNSVLTQEGVTILLVKGSIADQTTDAIVNSVGGNFDLTQGILSKAVLEKAGPKIQEELKSERPTTLRYGAVTTTKGFNLSAKFVFHGVLKKWNNGIDDAENVLRAFVANCLTEASRRRIRSIAFPAIGTGALAFPSADVVDYLINEADRFSSENPNTSINEIRFVVYGNDQKTFDAFAEELNKIKPNDVSINETSPREYLNDLGLESSSDEEEDQLTTSERFKKLNIEAKRATETFRQTGSEFPKTWKPISPGKRYETTLLTSSDDEFKMVSKKVMDTKGSAAVKSIVKIERIENRILYQLYTVHKKGMEETNGKSVENERSLWHGTPESSVVNICSCGFNRSYCGKNAVIYGKGAYFARDFQYSAQSKYSTPDDTGTKYVFLCKVLTGRFQRGTSDMVEPQMIPGTLLRYDSTVNDANNPTIFVAYRDSQAYPEYLVTFY